MPSTSPTPLCSQRITTPLGEMLACASDQGLCLLEFADHPLLTRECQALQRLLRSPIVTTGNNPHLAQAVQEIREYFRSQRQSFNVALHMPGTTFQQTVWHGLCHIPYGTTVSYQAFAHQLGMDKAVRAVAAANGANRVAIIAPCHRVIGKNGSLTGYSGGLHRKQWLLAHEGWQPALPLPLCLPLL